MNRCLVGTVVVAAAFAAGCRTTKDVLDDYEKNLAAGNYGSLGGEVRELAAKGDDTALLWQLMTGSGDFLAGQTSSTVAFDQAEDLFSDNDRESVFAKTGSGALAMMTNDRAFPYAGAGQDRVFTCFYKAVDYAARGERDAARTELNRAAQHQENWIYERRRDIDAAAKRMKEDADAYVKKETSGYGATAPAGDRDAQVGGVLSDAGFAGSVNEKCGFDPAASGNLDALAPKDYMNLYVHHACGVFRWLNGDGGRDFFKDVVNIQPGNSVAVRDFKEADAGAKPRNQVWVYVEDGLCPVREEWRLDLPLLLVPGLGNYVMYAGMALPYLRERPGASSAWSVSVSGAKVPLVELADVDKLMRTEYDVYMRGALTREITRTIVKCGVQVALGVCAEKANDWKTQVALKASQTGVAVWAASVTAADLRCWSALPKKAYVVRLDRPADGVVTISAGGRPDVSVTLPDGNAMVFVRKPSAAAPAVVKTIVFK